MADERTFSTFSKKKKEKKRDFGNEDYLILRNEG